MGYPDLRWGNPQAVPALRSALQAVWKLERRPGPFDGRWGLLCDEWHDFEDSLAYALGQLGAWGALTHVETPSSHLRFAMLYMMLGYLGVQFTMKPYYFSFGETSWQPAAHDLFKNSVVGKKEVRHVLAHRFGLSEEEQDTFFEHFSRDFAEREREAH